MRRPAFVRVTGQAMNAKGPFSPAGILILN